jgi:hypothetical protein
MHATFIINFVAASVAAGLKFLYLIMVSKVTLAIALMLWYHAIYCNGAFRLHYIARAVPLLAWELRACLNPRRWLIWLAQLVHHKTRLLVPIGADFLLRRDGYIIVDFFKKLSRSGISPPAIA